MADKRMMSKSVIDTDMFLDMPASTQCLYFHMLLRADDDGFLKNAKTIIRTVGASPDDIKLLIAKQYLIPFWHHGHQALADPQLHQEGPL